MTEVCLAPSEEAQAATSSAPAPVVGSSAARLISLRIDAEACDFIDRAAAMLGKTRTEFVIESAQRAAAEVLPDQCLFALDREHYEAIMRALDNPPEPGPKLQALMRRAPAWER